MYKYITTTLPYVNATPHIGHAFEFIQADVIARIWCFSGNKVFFNTGTDEHGQKIFNAAEKAGEEVRSYVDRYAKEFQKLKELLGLSDDLRFIRTTEERNKKAAQELWQRCKKDLYLKEFEGLYCVGCERFLSQRDMVDGKCVIHQTEPQKLKEKNWFFHFKKYEKELLKYLEEPSVILPDWRRKEAIDFVKEGLEDFSVSRDKSRLSWGVPVPGDDTQVMYVWFDALTNYISTLGWPSDLGDFKKFWEKGHTLQLAGKDQVRFQSLMWQAMLMSAGIKNTDQVFYHGFINSGGQKMSKSLGNVISPYDMVKKYGTEATRLILMRNIHPYEDTDVTWERLDEWYADQLPDGIGNLTSRIMTLAEKYIKPITLISFSWNKKLPKLMDEKAIDSIFRIDQILDQGVVVPVKNLDKDIDKFIQNKLDKKSQPGLDAITDFVMRLQEIAYWLAPFMPDTSETILKAIKENKKPENLFPRLDA